MYENKVTFVISVGSKQDSCLSIYSSAFSYAKAFRPGNVRS